MTRLLQAPLITAGLLLIVLGVGNWHTGLRKGAEYSQRLRTGQPPASEQPAYEFASLDVNSNAMLLNTLNRRRDPFAFVHDKLDFYEVVHAGGRLLVLLGMFLTAAGVVRRQRQQRSAQQLQALSGPS
jgi:uncharacterized membrane protein YidH (DUF202 family)